MPVEGSAMRETGLLTLVILDLVLPDERHPPLHEPLAGRPGLLIHPLAHHLSRKAISIQRLRFFRQIPLTQQASAQQPL